MRVTKITVRGKTGNFAAITKRDGGGQPNAERKGERKKGDVGATVEIEIIEPEGERILRAPASNRQHLWRIAEVLQERLDGYRGAGGDVRDYFDLIERIAGR